MTYLLLYGKYTMNCYPSAEKRRYAVTVPYRGYTIALWRSPDEPAFMFGDMPIYDLFFVLDELGDNALPIDVPFASPFECYSAIDLFCYLEANPEWKLRNGRNVWTYLMQNKCMERNVGEIMSFFHDLQKDMQSFNPDPDFGDDPKEFISKQLLGKIEAFLQRIPGWRQIQGYTLPK